MSAARFGQAFFPKLSNTETHKPSVSPTQEQSSVVTRLAHLDSVIKDKFQNNYKLVRKAFLENATDNFLTSDHLLSLFDSVN
jgi:hypothetical protein